LSATAALRKAGTPIYASTTHFFVARAAVVVRTVKMTHWEVEHVRNKKEDNFDKVKIVDLVLSSAHFANKVIGQLIECRLGAGRSSFIEYRIMRQQNTASVSHLFIPGCNRICLQTLKGTKVRTTSLTLGAPDHLHHSDRRCVE
jgi:hypothetical protein